MLNENIRARINAFVAAEIAPRRRAFKEALQAEQNRLNARGLLKSGVGVRAAVRLGADELRVRATIVRGAVLRSYSSMSGQLAGELRSKILGRKSEDTSATQPEMCNR